MSHLHPLHGSIPARLHQPLAKSIVGAPMVFGGAGGGVAPTFLSGATFSATEGADTTFSITVSEACDITITGGADANQFQLSGNLNTVGASLLLFSQSGASTLEVTLLATSIDTGLTAAQTLTVTVALADAPTALTPPVASVLAGGDWEGSTLTVTPGTYTGATSVTGQWQRGGPSSFVDIDGATGLTYRRAEADVNAGTIRYVETAVSVPGRETVQNSNALAVTISGVIAQMAMSGAAVDLSSAPRWAELLSTDTVSALHMPDAGIGAGDGAVGYDSWAPGFASFATTSASFPVYLRGQASTTGAGGRILAGVPNNQELRIKLAVGSGGAGPYTNEWSIRDGDTGTELAYAQSATIPTGAVLGGDGLSHLVTDWLSEDTGVLIPAFTTGVCSFRRKSGTPLYSHTLRAFQISYPEYALNLTTANLPGDTAYSDISAGNDATGDGATATPFQHLVGEPGAGGVVPTFVISAGGFNVVRAGTYLAINKSSRAGSLVLFNAPGTVGLPATLASDTGAAVILDGSTALTSWGAITSGDTGGAWENPFNASIVKYTGTALTGGNTALTDGEDHMFPSQFPNPANPADYDMAYEGSDAFMTITSTDFATKVSSDALNTCGVDGSAGTGYHKVHILSDTGTNNVKDHYGPDAINLDGSTVYIMINGNRLKSCLIADHVPATGAFAAVLVSTEDVFTPSVGTRFKYAIRGHVFDIRQTGQYAYIGATPYGAFETATRGRIDPLIVNGFKPTYNYLTIDGSAGAGGYLTIRRVGLAGAGIKDSGTGATPLQGLTLRGVHLTQVRDAYGRVVSFKSGSVGNYSTITLEDLKITECQGQPGIESMPGINGDGIYMRDLNGTALFVGTPAPSGTPTTWRNLNICDMSGIHANGIAAYLSAGYYSFEKAVIANVSICLSTQGGDGVTARNLSFKDMFLLGRLAFPGETYGATIYAYQYGEAELGATLEGLCMPNDYLFYGHSSTSTANTPSTGTVWKNCVFGDVIANSRADAFVGITMQDCLVLGKANGGGLASVADFVARGGTDGGGNVVVPHASYVAWNGGLTEAMQQALTANHGLGTYTERNIGNEAAAFGGTGKTLLVPAAGASFTLTDTWVSTDSVRKKFRVGLHGGVLASPEPDVTYSLPVGQGDNSLFALDSGNYWRFASDPSGASVRHLVVDKTTTNANVSGSSTKRTDISINLV